MQQIRIIFYGTPDFAVASLKALLDAGKQVIAVVTAPDKAAGRGLKLQPSAVKQFAIQHHIPVLQPEKLKSEEFLHALDEALEHRANNRTGDEQHAGGLALPIGAGRKTLN